MKRYHPDAAGDARIGRFLAVQAAYDALMNPASGHLPARPQTTARSGPWDADPDRAGATKRDYGRMDGSDAGAGQDSRRSSPGSAWDWARPGAAGSSRPASGPAGPSADPGPGPAAGRRDRGTSGEHAERGGGAQRRQRDHSVPKARPGSTTYDGEDAVTHSRVYTVFELMDAVSMKDCASSQRILKRYLEEEDLRDGPQKLIGMLNRQVRLLWQAKAVLMKRGGTQEIEKKTALTGFPVKKLMEQAPRWKERNWREPWSCYAGPTTV